MPTTVTHLSEITSGQLSPDHLPGTISPTLGMGKSGNSAIVGAGAGDQSGVGLPHRSSGDGQAGASGQAGTGMGVVGQGEGEWERQGLGKGLEQRLDDLAREQSPTGRAGRS